MLNRRLARYDETRPHHSEPMIHLAMSDLMAADSPVRAPSPGATLQIHTK